MPPGVKKRAEVKFGRNQVIGVYIPLALTDFCLDVTKSLDKVGTVNVPNSGRCPNLGPTRQDTVLYFKNLRQIESVKKEGCTGQDLVTKTFIPPKTAPFAINFESDGNVSLVNSVDEHHDLCNNFRLKAGLSKRENTALSLDTLRTSNNATFYSSSGDVGSSCDVISTCHRSMYPRQKIIIPSKHGFHPRSHSPTFKRLVQASSKLNGLLETFSVSGMTSPVLSLDVSDSGIHGSDASDDTDKLAVDRTLDFYEITTKQDKLHGKDAKLGFRVTGSTIIHKTPFVTPRHGISSLVNVDGKENCENGTKIHLFLPMIVPSSGDIHSAMRSPEPQQEDIVKDRTKLLPDIHRKSTTNNTTRPSHKRIRVVSKRSTSPMKPLNKAKQQKGRTCEEKEPFVRGESLKERLDDFPTLVSLDTS